MESCVSTCGSIKKKKKASVLELSSTIELMLLMKFSRDTSW